LSLSKKWQPTEGNARENVQGMSRTPEEYIGRMCQYEATKQKVFSDLASTWDR